MTNKNTIVRHHLLEIILWPNEDGTFRTIHNSAARLKELGIYDDYKMTIPMTSSEHVILHNTNRPDDYYQNVGKNIYKSMKGKTAWNKGKTGIYSEETRKKMSEARKTYLAKRKAKTI